MLKRPSSRRKSHSDSLELNLVPILDTMVTLIGFLLFTSSFMAIVSVETMAPVMSTEQVQKQLKEKPLQLTVSVRKKTTEIWSAFEKIRPVLIPHGADGEPDLLAVHEAILKVKTQFPQETKVVLSPHSGVSYDTLMALMDAVRVRQKTDIPITWKNPATSREELVTTLFSEVVFGNLLSNDTGEN